MIRRFWSWLVSPIDKQYVKDRADLAESVLASNLSSGDIEVLKATAPIISALCNNDTEGLSHVGLFIFYKIRKEDGNFQVFQKRLSPKEAAIIQKRPTLLSDPYSLLENIEAALAIDYADAEKLRAIAAKER